MGLQETSASLSREASASLSCVSIKENIPLCSFWSNTQLPAMMVLFVWMVVKKKTP